METKNPYAPPVETGDGYPTTPSGPGTLTLSAKGWSVVTDMAKWMRFLSVFYYLGAGMLLLAVPFVLVAVYKFKDKMLEGLQVPAHVLPISSSVFGTLAILGVVLMVPAAILIGLGGRWLRRAASHFFDGVRTNAERPLAHGFRNLRRYLILHGVFAIFGLLFQILQVMGAKWMGR